ncbi:14124_t:CDS:2 [Funneliformis mosseae]|uniref:14124_t:CDS:1 n=1 Tax=Funneliformis mosseae TaxID=27381 RepID=A0A9N9GZ79_FUNMO|nr:14124_t:CDS:2 [Funneliformis mosseae]
MSISNYNINDKENKVSQLCDADKKQKVAEEAYEMYLAYDQIRKIISGVK